MFLTSVNLATADPWHDLLEKYRANDWTLKPGPNGVADFAREDGRFARAINMYIDSGSITNLLDAAELYVFILDKLARFFKAIFQHHRLYNSQQIDMAICIDQWLCDSIHPSELFNNNEPKKKANMAINDGVKAVYGMDIDEAMFAICAKVYSPLEDILMDVFKRAEDCVRGWWVNGISLVPALKKEGFSKKNVEKICMTIDRCITGKDQASISFFKKWYIIKNELSGTLLSPEW
ncbi:MAG: hypothetical protein LBI37_01405 [Puniceicoccales bacterium]|nr:hypothetical protein [Puniceicoccales bacterium]